MAAETENKDKKYISGVGGIFFRAKDPKGLGAWYERFFFTNSMDSNHLWMQEAGPTVFAPFKEDTGYFGRMEQMFMLNFRVRNLDEFLIFLAESGVKVDEKRQDEGYGRFAWVYDPEGNKIELWETTD